MITLYQYKKVLPLSPHARGKQTTHIIDTDKVHIIELISKEEFSEFFGGYLMTTKKEPNSKKLEFIGVWGKDKIQKLKKVLRDRKIEFEIVEIDGASRHIGATAQDWSGSAFIDS